MCGRVSHKRRSGGLDSDTRLSPSPPPYHLLSNEIRDWAEGQFPATPPPTPAPLRLSPNLALGGRVPIPGKYSLLEDDPPHSETRIHLALSRGHPTCAAGTVAWSPKQARTPDRFQGPHRVPSLTCLRQHDSRAPRSLLPRDQGQRVGQAIAAHHPVVHISGKTQTQSQLAVFSLLPQRK